MQVNLDRIGHGVCELRRRGLSVCLLDGGGKVDVGRDWCGWVCGTLCGLVNRQTSCRYQYPEKVGGHLLLFPL